MKPHCYFMFFAPSEEVLDSGAKYDLLSDGAQGSTCYFFSIHDPKIDMTCNVVYVVQK